MKKKFKGKKIFEKNPDLLLKSMVKLVQPHYGYSFRIELTPHSTQFRSLPKKININ